MSEKIPNHFRALREVCPKCGSGKVRRAAAFWKNIRRFFQNSRRRICMDCGVKWTAGTVRGGRRNNHMITAIIFLIVIGVGLWIMVFSKESDNAQEDEPSYVQMEGDDEAPLST